MLGMRGHHTETIQKLKSQFLKEKKEFQHESEAKIQEVAKQANRVCMRERGPCCVVTQLL